MAHKIELAYRYVKPPNALIMVTLEKVRKERLRQSIILLILQLSVSAAVCAALGFAISSYAVCAGLFVGLCLVFAVAFCKKNNSYLEGKFMSDDKARMTDLSLGAVVGGNEDNSIIIKSTPHCLNCGTVLPCRQKPEPCPECGFIDEQF